MVSQVTAAEGRAQHAEDAAVRLGYGTAGRPTAQAGDDTAAARQQQVFSLAERVTLRRGRRAPRRRTCRHRSGTAGSPAAQRGVGCRRLRSASRRFGRAAAAGGGAERSTSSAFAVSRLFGGVGAAILGLITSTPIAALPLTDFRSADIRQQSAHPPTPVGGEDRAGYRMALDATPTRRVGEQQQRCRRFLLLRFQNFSS